ncbi:MAG: hypothetical protein J6C07_01715 [Lachnospiraceae bacterium]|nr:hypothetical protein [Lachnospiraceae bacterium]
MSKERILETIGQVKDEFIEEAAPKGLLSKESEEETPIGKRFPKVRVVQLVKWGALAACLCIIAGITMNMDLFSASKEDMAYDSVQQMKQTTESVKSEAESPLYNYTGKADADFATQDTNTSVIEETMKNGEYGLTEPGSADQGFPDWGLTLSVEEVSATGLTLVVSQEGGNPTGELQTGDPYRLITLVDGSWKTVEELPLPEGVDGRAWNSIAYLLPKGETREFEINWEWIFGELPTGTYRLIKEFMDFRGTANYDTFEYWVEFNVQ